MKNKNRTILKKTSVFILKERMKAFKILEVKSDEMTFKQFVNRCLDLYVQNKVFRDVIREHDIGNLKGPNYIMKH